MWSDSSKVTQVGMAELGFKPKCLLDPRAWELPCQTLLLTELEEPGLAFYVIQFGSISDIFESSCSVPGPVLGPGEGR